MHINPCGRAVDWIQFPFEVDARIHNSADAPIVRQRWLFTDQPFLPLGTNCVLMNRVWDGDDATEYRVGMLPPAENNFVQDARWHLTPGLKGKHICHPEWLATGEPDNDLPDTNYDSNQIPTCCGLGTDGGLEIGGAVGDVWTPHQWGADCCAAPVVQLATVYATQLGGGEPGEKWYRWNVLTSGYTLTLTGISGSPISYAEVFNGPACNNTTQLYHFNTSGPQTLSGINAGTLCVRLVHAIFSPNFVSVRLDQGAPPPPPFVDGTAGGIEVGGEVGEVQENTDATSGGGSVGGEVGDTPGAADGTAGGGSVGGEVGDVPGGIDTSAGGGSVGGEVGDVPGGIDTSAGGGSVGGSAGDVSGGIDTSAGGGSVGGSAGDVPGGIDTSAGGGSVGGSAGDVFSGAPTVRGTTSGNVASGWTLPTPAVGDLLVVFLAGDSATAPLANAGWSRGSVRTWGSASQNYLTAYTRVATGSDGTPALAPAGVYVAYALVGNPSISNSTTARAVSATTAAQVGSMAVTTPVLLLACWVCDDLLDTASYPAGFTLDSYWSTTPQITVGEKNILTTPTGVQTATLSAARFWGSYGIAFH